MQTLRIVPNLRSAVLEERPPGQAVLFTSALADSDAALLLDEPAVRPFTWSGLLRALRDPELRLVEVAEPLWVGEWVRAVRYVVVARAVGLLRRRRLLVATYAIDNVDVRERVGERAPALRVAALGASLLLLDRIAFGTSGAFRSYERAFGWSLRRIRHAVLTPRLDVCSVCGPVAAGTPRRPVVLFLGTPSERKGFPGLMRAWARTGAADAGWRLLVLAPAPVEGGDLPAGVTVESGPSRAAIHALLRTCAVVAMPSVRRPGWREQIGLPLVEGLTHGARVVTTTETGLADDLREHPLVTFTVPGDPDSLAAGLRAAMDGTGHPMDAPPCPGHTKRDVVRWWLDGDVPERA